MSGAVQNGAIVVPPPAGSGSFMFDDKVAEPPVATELSTGRRSGFFENLSAGFDSAITSDVSTSRAINEGRARSEREAAIAKVSGKSFSQTIEPFRAKPGQRPSDDQGRIDDAAVDAWLATIPERQREGILPSAMLGARGIEIGKEHAADAASVMARGRGGWETAAAFGGQVAGQMTDPLNIAGLAFGAPLSSGILRTALTESAIAAGTQAAIEPVVEPYRAKLGLEHGLGRAAENVVLAGVGGGVIGGGLKAAGTGWRAVADRLGRAGVVRDLGGDAGAAFDQVQAFDDLMSTNPFDDVPAGRAEHRARAMAVDEAVMGGQPLPALDPARPVTRDEFVDALKARTLAGERETLDRFGEQIAGFQSVLQRGDAGGDVKPAYAAELQSRLADLQGQIEARQPALDRGAWVRPSEEAIDVAFDRARADGFKGFDFGRPVARDNLVPHETSVLARGEADDLRPASALGDYARNVAIPAKGAPQEPRVLFDLGRLSDDVAASARRAKPEWSDVPPAARISNQVVDKLYRNHPADADELLAELPDLIARPAEVLPDHQHADRVLFARPFGDKNAVGVVEVARKRDGLEIVSLHKSPDRTLAKARALLAELKGRLGKDGDSAGGAAGPSSGDQPLRVDPAGAASKEDFPTVGTVDQGNIGAEGRQINPETEVVARAGLQAQTEKDLGRIDQAGGEGVQSQTRQFATDLSRAIKADGDFDVPVALEGAEGVQVVKASSLLDDAIEDKVFLDGLKGCLK